MEQLEHLMAKAREEVEKEAGDEINQEGVKRSGKRRERDKRAQSIRGEEERDEGGGGWGGGREEEEEAEAASLFLSPEEPAAGQWAVSATDPNGRWALCDKLEYKVRPTERKRRERRYETLLRRRRNASFV